MAKKRPSYAIPHGGASAPKAALPAEPKQSPLDYLLPLILGVVYFILAALSSSETIKGLAMTVAIAALVAVAARFKVLRDRFGSPMLALALFVTMGGISTLYAISGKFALNEFLKIYASFCMTLILLAAAPGQGDKPGRWIATIVSGAGALFSLVSIDLLSTHFISTPILGFLGLFTSAFENVDIVESGVRMTSMVDNPNVFAGTVGIGVLLSLGLAGSSESRTERNIHIAILYINALAFILAFSMGATAAIAVGFIVCLLLEKKEKRSALFILMLEALVLVLLPTMLISQTSFTTWDGFDVVPTLCAVLGAAALVALDTFVGSRVTAWLANKGKLMFALIGGALAVVVVFGVLAVTITGSAELAAGESLRRAAYPEAGEYEIFASFSGSGDLTNSSLTVRIESQNDVETMMHTSTVLYSGELNKAKFTVPEDSTVVYFNITAHTELELYEVELHGGSVESLPLDYPLLPGFIANRLQGLFANENAIQRLVFFEDGMKLFRRSPIVGLGLGAYENGIKNVQSFYYETKYAHNHYIQTLAETGVVGLILFVALLGVSAVAILRSFRREDAHPLTAVLGGALAFMAIHAATEVVFSFYSYLPMAYATFGLINLCCGDGLKLPFLCKKGRAASLAGISAFVLAFAILLGCNMSARSTVDRRATFSTLEKAISLDKFEWADYMLSYVNGVMTNEVDAETDAKSVEYAERLAEVNSNTIPRHLANYWFSRGEDAKAFEMLAKYCDYVSSDSEAWNNAFDLLEFYDDGSESYKEGALALVAQLETWEANNLGSITLNEKSRLYVESLGE